MQTFWTKGEANYKKALRIEYEAKCEQLKSRIRQTINPDELSALTEELETLKRDFQKRLHGSGRSLF